MKTILIAFVALSLLSAPVLACKGEDGKQASDKKDTGTKSKSADTARSNKKTRA